MLTMLIYLIGLLIGITAYWTRDISLKIPRLRYIAMDLVP